MTEDQDIEEIRRKRLEEAYAKLQEQAALEAKMDAIARKYLEPNAYERLMNVKLSNRERYYQVVNLISMYGPKMNRKLTDAELLNLLKNLTQRREPRIIIKRK
ncbi:hypothetical protein J7K41_01250 [Candidatus Micrarchaeota archaeon]|nr:hypothetical protein [Candidatus Micrarchaeota archaeon]